VANVWRDGEEQGQRNVTFFLGDSLGDHECKSTITVYEGM
jgi:hypothetical protein